LAGRRRKLSGRIVRGRIAFRVGQSELPPFGFQHHAVTKNAGQRTVGSTANRYGKLLALQAELPVDQGAVPPAADECSPELEGFSKLALIERFGVGCGIRLPVRVASAPGTRQERL
jgi:hypothetical protein